jgi:hypothetical protein
MKKFRSALLGLFLLATGASFAFAQNNSSTSDEPQNKVLRITRELIKPGKSGALHDKSEAAFVQAMAHANWPVHYIAYSSLSGPSRALYLTRYESFEALQKDNDGQQKNETLAAALERAAVTDGDLLDGIADSIWTYEPDFSYHSRKPDGNVRYMRMAFYHVRPGHNGEWREIVKTVTAAYDKMGSSAHWGTYSLAYGSAPEMGISAGSYVMMSGMPSLRDLDDRMVDSPKFRETMGEDGMKKLGELMASAVDNINVQLYAVNPRQSYPPEEWVNAAPDFWKSKPMMASAPASKSAAKATTVAKKTP